MGATLWPTAYCADSVMPSVDVDCEVTNLMVAFLAMAPAHSTSMADSSSSSHQGNPGSGPLMIICGSLGGRPALLRNVRTSDNATSTRPSTAMLCPVPSSPCPYSGPTS